MAFMWTPALNEVSVLAILLSNRVWVSLDLNWTELKLNISKR